MAESRDTARRKADTLALLATEVDCWVPSADARGDTYLIPLSFIWRDGQLTLATPTASRTARNLQRAGQGRIALGGTRDVVIIDGPLTFAAREAVTPDLAGAFAEATGFDPRRLAEEYVYITLTPQRIQAWREANELTGREIMRAGRWLA